MASLLARFVTEAWGYTCRNGLFEPICFYQGGTKNWHSTVIKILFRTLVEKKDDKNGG